MTKTPFVPKEPGYYWWLCETPGSEPEVLDVFTFEDDEGRCFLSVRHCDSACPMDTYLKGGTFAPGPLIPPDDKEFG